MTIAFDDQKTLASLDAQIEEARQGAASEAAFNAAHGEHERNPWEAWGKRLADLQAAREQLRLRLEGESLSRCYEELQALDKELEHAEQERKAVDQILKEKSENATMEKWRAAGSIARRYGYGHSWLLYSNWILSGKSRQFAPECILYIEQEGPGELCFSEEEQKIVREWAKAQDESNRTLLKWSSLRDRRQKLLQDWPQLRTAS